MNEKVDTLHPICVTSCLQTSKTYSKGAVRQDERASFRQYCIKKYAREKQTPTAVLDEITDKKNGL